MGEAGFSGGRWLQLAAALALLNSSLTFVSVWPTLAVRPTLQLSAEAAALVFVLTTMPMVRGRSAARWIAAGAISSSTDRVSNPSATKCTTCQASGRSSNRFVSVAMN